MPSLFLALLSLLPIINAQSTVSIFMPEADPGQSLVASIVNAVSLHPFVVATTHPANRTPSPQDATATTYLVKCASANASASSSSSSAECGFPPSGITHIQGPSTAGYGPATAAISCQLTGTTRAVCTASSNLGSDTRTDMPAMASATGMEAAMSTSAPAMASGPSGSTLPDGREVVTLMASDLEGAFLPVVVTAGQQKAMGASGSGSSSTATGSAGTKTMSAGSRATGSTSTGGTATGSAAAQKATGAAGRVSVEGVVGGMGALAVGVVAAML